MARDIIVDTSNLKELVDTIGANEVWLLIDAQYKAAHNKDLDQCRWNVRESVKQEFRRSYSIKQWLSGVAGTVAVCIVGFWAVKEIHQFNVIDMVKTREQYMRRDANASAQRIKEKEVAIQFENQTAALEAKGMSACSAGDVMGCLSAIQKANAEQAKLLKTAYRLKTGKGLPPLDDDEQSVGQLRVITSPNGVEIRDKEGLQLMIRKPEIQPKVWGKPEN